MRIAERQSACALPFPEIPFRAPCLRFHVLPEDPVQKSTADSPKQWVEVAKADTVTEGHAIEVVVAGLVLAIFRDQEKSMHSTACVLIKEGRSPKVKSPPAV